MLNHLQQLKSSQSYRSIRAASSVSELEEIITDLKEYGNLDHVVEAAEQKITDLQEAQDH
jgi:hypothetical protein